MSLAWMAYGLAVGTLLSVAAWASERLLRSTGRQGRWAWVAAGLGSVLVPAAVMGGLGPEIGVFLDGFLSVGGGSGGEVQLPAATVVSESTRAAVEGGWSWSFLPGLSRAAELGLLGAWIATTAALLGLYGLTWKRLRRRIDSWPMTEVDGTRVRLTRATGPAVVGVLRPVMMVPDWVRDLPARERRLVLRHEREHMEAGDSRLLALFPLLAALVPWNLPLWWQLRRLRLAVELDCDARVLSDGGEPRSYGRLLVSMTRRPEGRLEGEALPLTTAALLERRSDLERRIRSMTDTEARPSLLRTIALAALAGVALVVACDTPAPVASDPESESRVDARGSTAPTTVPEAPVEKLAPPPAGGSVDDRPAFVPHDVKPRLVNVEEIRARLQRVYPSELKDAGIGGRAVVWLLVGADGAVDQVRIQRSTDYASLDSAAVHVARDMQFSPALNRDEPLRVWISQPVTFRPGATGTRGTLRKLGVSPPAPREGPADRPLTLREIEGADGAATSFEIRSDSMRRSEQQADTVRTSTVRLRGVMSVDAAEHSEQPLIIVDGVVLGTDADLEELNSLDIEKIEVVKGPAAKSLYGKRAADGVIQITTMDADGGG